MIKNYYKDESLRKKMSVLANQTFGLDFELLYQKGYWDKAYSCYSILEDDKIVSNVSFHLLELEKAGKRYSAMSIGSVMTDTDYRGKDYARQLMNEVMKDHPVDVYFLGANETVLNFYPRFGFKPVILNKFVDNNLEHYIVGDKGKKLDIEKDLELIDSYVKNRIKNSKDMYVYGDDYLKMFYMLYLYSDHIYLHDGAIIVCEKEEDKLYVYDIYQLEEKNIFDLVGPYTKGVNSVYYSFEAKIDTLEAYADEEAYLFVKTEKIELLEAWSYPGTSVT